MNRPIIKRGPLATVFFCPKCGHKEIGRKSVRFDCTRADGRIRSHIAKCLTKEAA